MKLSLEQMACIEWEILRQVRASPGVSRVELARRLQIAPSTAGSYVGRLITEGFLEESETAGSAETGRPPTALRLKPDGGRFIGVDFEARNIMALAVDFSDKPLKHARLSIQESDSVPRIIGKIEQAIHEVLPNDTGPLLAIGVGVPGLVDPTRGVAVHYKYIPRWQNIALAAPLAEQFGVPVYLENTIRSMALAEMWFGQGRGVEDFLCIGIRSGIGAGIVAGGQLQRGTEHRAGEIGRWRCPWPSRAAARLFAGNDAAAANTELQDVASVRAIVSALERARRGAATGTSTAGRRPLDFADVARAARQRDPLTIQILEAAAAMLGGAVAQLVLALNSSRVILAGPLTLLGDTLLRPLRKRAAEILLASDAEVPVIVNSSMGEYSGALGAAALAVHEWKPAR